MQEIRKELLEKADPRPTEPTGRVGPTSRVRRFSSLRFSTDPTKADRTGSFLVWGMKMKGCAGLRVSLFCGTFTH